MNDVVFRFFRRSIDDAWSAYLSNKNSAIFASSMLMIIDSLSRIVAKEQDKSKSRFRFTNFVREYCGWNDANRICLLLLREKTNANHCVYCRNIIGEFQSYIEKINNGSTISNDPLSTADLFQSVCDCDAIQKALIQSQHESILYNLRNDVIHEGKVCGQGHILEAVDPYYFFSRNDSDERNPIIKLYYPPLFFKKLSLSGLNQMEMFVNSMKVDVRDVYKYSQYAWPKLLPISE